MTRSRFSLVGGVALLLAGCFLAVGVGVLLGGGPLGLPLYIRTLMIVGAGLCLAQGLLLLHGSLPSPGDAMRASKRNDTEPD